MKGTEETQYCISEVNLETNIPIRGWKLLNMSYQSGNEYIDEGVTFVRNIDIVFIVVPITNTLLLTDTNTVTSGDISFHRGGLFGQLNSCFLQNTIMNIFLLPHFIHQLVVIDEFCSILDGIVHCTVDSIRNSIQVQFCRRRKRRDLGGRFHDQFCIRLLRAVNGSWIHSMNITRRSRSSQFQG